MLPDLSENLTDEERTWEQIQEIKTMPISMTQKKELRTQLQSAEKLRLQGFDQIRWQQRKLWQLFGTKLKSMSSKLELWKSSIKRLEGNFGTGIAAYFVFIKWVMFLNLTIFSIMFFMVILPNVLLEEKVIQKCDYMEGNFTDSCYENNVNISLLYTPVLDFIQGSGAIERTLMFYGGYNYNDQINSSTFGEIYFSYDLSLAYIISAFVAYIVSLIAIMRSATSGFKERLERCEGQFYQYCNIIFVGWDFCIHNKKSAAIKHKAIYNEMHVCLQNEYFNGETDKKCKLIIIRLIANFFVIILLLGTCVTVHFVSDYSYDVLNMEQLYYDTADDAKTFFIQFLPSFTIVFLNMFIPLIFNIIVKFEHYSPIAVIRFTLLRSIVLRLLCLAILLSRLYFLFCRGTSFCWETYVGQQFYRLFITDFTFHIIVTFFINLPRSLLVKSVDNNFTQFIGAQNFELSKHVLDIIYAQTLCWLGLFYSPFLPAIAVCYCFFMFYIKKFACFINSKPSYVIYRASKSKSLFMLVILFNFFVAIIPVLLALTEIAPSESCGPFRGLSSAWQSIKLSFMVVPEKLKDVIIFFSTISFTIPAFVALLLVVGYYNIVYSINKHMVLVLKKQLVLEGHDKQFLLDRLSSFIKQQQEYQKDLS